MLFCRRAVHRAPATTKRKAPATATAQGGVSSGGRKSALGAAWRNLTLPPFTYNSMAYGRAAAQAEEEEDAIIEKKRKKKRVFLSARKREDFTVFKCALSVRANNNLTCGGFEQCSLCSSASLNQPLSLHHLPFFKALTFTGFVGSFFHILDNNSSY